MTIKMIERWKKIFQERFDNELNKRLWEKTRAKFGIPPLYLWCADWNVDEIVKREWYQKEIVEDTCIEVLKDNTFKDSVSAIFSYRLTGNGCEIEIYKIIKESNFM